jgi:uncharacterized protein YuzB (UPF0349 family)
LSQYGRPPSKKSPVGYRRPVKKAKSGFDASSEIQRARNVRQEKEQRRVESEKEFEADREYYNKIKPSLMKSEKYRNKYVAIVKGELVASGDNELELVQKIYKEYGKVPMYVSNPSVQKQVIDV